MKERQLSNWIDSYMEYMEETESAKILHKWCALSIIASVLRKKVFLSLGRIKVYPNMYIVFVGEPGGPRKSQAISFGINFLNEIPDVVLSADAITPQAMIDDLETCAVDEQMPDGSVFKHASLTVTSKEFESFLGQKSDNTKMIILLTDLFDAQELPWKYRTKSSGTNVVPSVFLNILAATTPESISSSLPSSAIGSGLTSRIVFVWADNKSKKVTIPVETEEEKVLKEKLHKDLYLISRICGGYSFSPEALRKWDHWYQTYNERDPNRICKDPTFNGWYERKPLYIQKLSLVNAAAESSELLIEWHHIEKSIKLLEEIEVPMANVFRAIGRSLVSTDVDLAFGVIKAKGVVSEKELLSIVWRDIDAGKFDNVIQTLLRSGRITRKYKGPKGEPGVWYYVGTQ